MSGKKFLRYQVGYRKKIDDGVWGYGFTDKTRIRLTRAEYQGWRVTILGEPNTMLPQIFGTISAALDHMCFVYEGPQ